MNVIYIFGRLGADPESKVTDAGTTITTLRVASSERYKDKQGQTVDKTEWHRVASFGKVAEVIAAHFKKGDPILLQGRSQTRKWQDKDGKDVYTTEIMLEKFWFVGGKQKPEEGGAGQVSHDQSNSDVPFDDDIPF